MKRTKIQEERLSKLLDHMKKGKLSVKEFNFGTFRDDTICGTSGCMGGELPVVFTEWTLSRYKTGAWYPILKETKDDPERLGMAPSNTTFIDDAAKFFGLERDEITRLFYPSGGLFGPDEQVGLGDEATRKEVADQLERFLIEEKVLNH